MTYEIKVEMVHPMMPYDGIRKKLSSRFKLAGTKRAKAKK